MIVECMVVSWSVEEKRLRINGDAGDETVE